MKKYLPRKREQYSYWPHHRRKNYHFILFFLAVFVVAEYTFLFQEYKILKKEQELQDKISSLEVTLQNQDVKHKEELSEINNLMKLQNDLILEKLSDGLNMIEGRIESTEGLVSDIKTRQEEYEIELKNQIKVLEKTNPDFPNMIETAIQGVVSVETEEEEGSGFAISNKLIVTNSHVIDDRSSIVVHTWNGKSFSARVIKENIPNDIAVLEVLGNPDFEILKLGDSSKMRVGDKVLALGHPGGLDYSASSGIISAMNRERIMEQDVIQVDMSVNPGNSGGPLLNSEGDVIGVVTLKARGYEGLSFAVQSNYLKNFVGLS